MAWVSPGLPSELFCFPKSSLDWRTICNKSLKIMKTIQIGTVLLLSSAFLLGCQKAPNHQQENGDVVRVIPAYTVVFSDTGNEEKGLDFFGWRQ